MTYDEWLALDPKERAAAHSSWDTQGEENIAIPEEALRRLIRGSEVPIAGGLVGIYHGGEYVLNPIVAAADIDRVPGFFRSSFDGFRVGYIEAERFEGHPIPTPGSEVNEPGVSLAMLQSLADAVDELKRYRERATLATLRSDRRSLRKVLRALQDARDVALPLAAGLPRRVEHLGARLPDLADKLRARVAAGWLPSDLADRLVHWGSFGNFLALGEIIDGSPDSTDGVAVACAWLGRVYELEELLSLAQEWV